MVGRTFVEAMLAFCAIWLLLGGAAAVPALHTDSVDDLNPFATILLPITSKLSGRKLLTSRSVLETASRSNSSSGVAPAVLPVTDFDQRADDQDCISDPEEFVRVWRSPKPSDRDRCVDESIIVRLANGRAACSSLQEVLQGFFTRLSPLSFWAFKDAPEKYLRIGVPQTVGSYVDGAAKKAAQSNPTFANWANPLFPGVRDPSNGVSMLTQIGFGSDFYRIDRVYLLFVGKRDKAKMSAAGVPTFVPTWDNVRVFYQDYIREYIAQHGALGHSQNFSIPKEVTGGGAGFPGLANIDLSDLTGCPSQCTYEDTKYPLPASDVPTRVPAFTPGAYANHTKGSDACDVPVVMVPKNASACRTEMIDVGAKLVKNGRLMLAEPTQLAVNDNCTDPDWKRYFLVGDFSGTPTWSLINGTVVWTGGKFPGLYEICNKERQYPGPLFMSAFLQEWNKIATTDYRKKAVLFRAFLMAGCAGNFNQLFSGNGLIYTGNGGVSSPTVHELLLGGINSSEAEVKITGSDQLLGNYGYAFFCIDGTQDCCPNGNCKSLSKPAWSR